MKLPLEACFVAPEVGMDAKITLLLFLFRSSSSRTVSAKALPLKTSLKEFIFLLFLCTKAAQ